jgi:hypothetical protein
MGNSNSNYTVNNAEMLGEISTLQSSVANDNEHSKFQKDIFYNQYSKLNKKSEDELTNDEITDRDRAMNLDDLKLKQE